MQKFTSSEGISGEMEAGSSQRMPPLSHPLSKRAGSSGSRKGARFNNPADSAAPAAADDDETFVEITLDLLGEDPEVTLLVRTLEKKSSFGSAAIRNASSKIREVSQELKRLASLSRRSRSGWIERSKSAAADALKGLKFINGVEGWPAVEKRFKDLAKEGPVRKAQFGQCIGMGESDFAGKLFDVLARRVNMIGDSITQEKLKEFWYQISVESFDCRLQIFFDMVDKNADGRITEEDVKEIISLSASANKLSKIQEKAGEYASLIMEELDPNSLSYIGIYDLKRLLLQEPSQSALVGTTDSRNLSKMLSQKRKPTKEPNPLRRWYQQAKYFFEDNWRRIWIMALWLGICAGLFAWKFIQYRNRAVFHIMGYCVCTAKGAAETLKFNMAIILLPVCRITITWLRNKTKPGGVVPFDDNINFHKVIAVGIAIGVGMHAGAHLTCDFPLLLHASDQDYVSMKPFFGETRPNNYWWFVKGTEGWTGIVMVVLMTVAFVLAAPWFRLDLLKLLPKPLKSLDLLKLLPKPLKSLDLLKLLPKPLKSLDLLKLLSKPLKKLTGFNAFWYSHHLFVIVYILLIVHGIFLYLSKEWYKKTTWMYVAAPVILYATERLIRAFRPSIRPVKILEATKVYSHKYPGKKDGSAEVLEVLGLRVSRPQGFKYRSGQYIFVNCAAVSLFEWHPFSITSAPQDDYVSVHIKASGDWTQKLLNAFREGSQPSANGTENVRDGNSVGSTHKVLIDGPYGAPAQGYKEYKTVLLVGLGIGATPFISILKDIVNNMKLLNAAADIERGPAGSGDRTEPSFKTRRAYFYWMTREQGSFEWFKEVMDEVAEADKTGAIELHNHCTSVHEEGDARSALITMLQSLNHAKNGVDVVSGTRVKCHFARPNWRRVYKRIALKHLDQRIGVFYCGKPEPVNELRQLALHFSRDDTSTKFDFHKENF